MPPIVALFILGAIAVVVVLSVVVFVALDARRRPDWLSEVDWSQLPEDPFVDSGR
ncbi:hypothetical protein ACEZCY_18865 [Streptacidiphilus sp. N1-12]|uniref:Uncharacterized protein n=2 Tax=Streptacidiphilus alkalitolerans TaxID=3342712 RepID=A0ABV6VBM2_9ACTN